MHIMTRSFGKLVLALPDGRTQEFMLSALAVTLGRDETNDVVLHDGKVSRHHARLESGDAGYAIVDLGSENGTFVDGVRVDRATLVTGNVITLGDSTLRLDAPAPAAAGAGTAETAPPAPGIPRPSRRVSRAQIQDILLKLETEGATSPLASPGEMASLSRGQPAYLTARMRAVTMEVQLDKGDVWTIGRDASNDVHLDDSRVSRRHARIERRDQTFVISDLGSSNGTWLGDRRIDTHSLSDGDTLTIGAAELVFHAAFVPVKEPAAPEAQTARRPVIIVPGTMGSALWRGSERLWPSVRNLLMRPEIFALPDASPVEARGVVGEVVIVPKLFRLEQYDRIGDFLESSLGYERGKDLLELAYDWRVDMRVAAQQMAETIERWAPALPVTIIAHSQGCLVTRYYVERLGGRRKVGRLVLIGGPNYGAPNAPLQMWPSDLAHLLPASQSAGGSLGRRLRETFATFPAAYQFLPTYSCIVDQHGAPLDLTADDSWLPPDKRPLLQMAREFHQQLPRRSSVPTVCIVGYGMKTIVRMEIERDAEGTWKRVHLVEEHSGDGTVPTDSAILLGADIHPVEQDHNSLYIDKDVMMRLKLELTR
jgi:pSer/pThr/pTyr-binding forkhead associated (FHA) protein